MERNKLNIFMCQDLKKKEERRNNYKNEHFSKSVIFNFLLFEFLYFFLTREKGVFNLSFNFKILNRAVLAVF